MAGSEDATAGADPTAAFFAGLPGLTAFADALDGARYAAVPDSWVLGLADVVTSTEAIESGRYKVVNTAGAAVISAVSNALGSLDFPFVFGGDGASFAVGPDAAGRAVDALAATVAWVGSELGLRMRGAAVEVSAIRRAGADLRVARFAVSRHVSYALFAGGGRDWAERELKAGRRAVPTSGVRPNLDGLSCRFRPLAARRGAVVSLIAKPRPEAPAAEVAAALGDMLAIAEAEPRAGNPVPPDGPERSGAPQGLAVEARLQRRSNQPLLASRLRVALRSLAAEAVLRRNRPFRGFSPESYTRELVANADFRKFDDGLMMTLDCSLAAAAAIEARLGAAERAGLLDFGLHRQAAALITCVVPSATRPGHVHFVDGASGGYATAATQIKRKLLTQGGARG